MNSTLLSIAVITYNHEKYISQAIESVLAQKTDFDYELVIGEDHSQDKTYEICQQYKKKYPNIKLTHSKKNIGATPNFVRTLQACKSKYIAILEGDDYWTDPYKLQKQVDFLEKKPDYHLCFTDITRLEADGTSSHYFAKNRTLYKTLYLGTPLLELDFFTLNDFLFPGVCVPTLTAVYRNFDLTPVKHWYTKCYMGDMPLFIMLAAKGKAHFIPEITGTYRIHPGGNFSSLASNPIKILNRTEYAYVTTGKNIGVTHLDSYVKGRAKLYLTRTYFMTNPILKVFHLLKAIFFLLRKRHFTSCIKLILHYTGKAFAIKIYPDLDLTR